MEVYRDCNGIAFDEVREILKRGEFPPMACVKDVLLLDQFRMAWDHCQACGWPPRARHWSPTHDEYNWLETHHIEGGTKGRSDEACNLVRLCHRCHQIDLGTARLTKAEVLWCKWRLDRPNTDWVRLTVLRGSYMMDIEPAIHLLEKYRRNRHA